MTNLLSRVVPREQSLVDHVPPGKVEWPGTIEHIENTIPSGLPLIPARVGSGKSPLERIKERGWFPDWGAKVLQERHEARALAAPRPQPPRRSGVVRPAPDPRHRAGEHVPRHRRGRPVAAPGLFGRHAATRLQLPHPRLAHRPPLGGGAASPPLPGVRRLSSRLKAPDPCCRGSMECSYFHPLLFLFDNICSILQDAVESAIGGASGRRSEQWRQRNLDADYV